MGVPNAQTYRWPCINPLVLKTKQKREFRERTGREETWSWQKWAIEWRQWTTVMRMQVCIENVKEETSHLYNNFVKTLIILCNVFWSYSLIQPLSSLSASQALSFEPHPNLPLSSFCVSPPLWRVMPVLKCDQLTEICILYENLLYPSSSPWAFGDMWVRSHYVWAPMSI